MKEQWQTSKQAIDGAIRASVRSRPPRQLLHFDTHDMGIPKLDITKATRLAGELEDQQKMYVSRDTPTR